MAAADVGNLRALLEALYDPVEGGQPLRHQHTAVGVLEEGRHPAEEPLVVSSQGTPSPLRNALAACSSSIHIDAGTLYAGVISIGLSGSASTAACSGGSSKVSASGSST